MNFNPFGQQLGIASLNKALAQPAPRSVEADTPMPVAEPLGPAGPPGPGGEPELSRVMATLSSDEVADYRTWGDREKFLFILAYQYMAVMSASNLKRPDGMPFQGPFPQSIEIMMTALKLAEPYIKNFPEDVAKQADQTASVLHEAATKSGPRAVDLTKKYALLRDRVAWELANKGLTIEYEVVGTDPSNPNVIYKRRIGEPTGSADLVAVFSQKSPKEMWEDGLKLQSKFEEIGVTFKKLDMSGANLRLGVGPALILGIIITAIIALLSAWWLWSHLSENKRLMDLAIQSIQADPNLSPAEKADRIMRIRAANSFFTAIFGVDFPWTTLIIGATVVGIAFVGLPLLFSSKKEPERKLRTAGAWA